MKVKDVRASNWFWLIACFTLEETHEAALAASLARKELASDSDNTLEVSQAPPERQPEPSF